MKNEEIHTLLESLETGKCQIEIRESYVNFKKVKDDTIWCIESLMRNRIISSRGSIRGIFNIDSVLISSRCYYDENRPKWVKSDEIIHAAINIYRESTKMSLLRSPLDYC